jgi:hypothetical protein
MICRRKNQVVRIISILIEVWKKKFILTDKFVINSFGIKLFQIKCTKSFKYAQKGDFGGYVEKEGNLDQENDAWVFGNARVSGDAWVSGNAWVSGDADIENDNEHCGFDGFGSCNRHTHAYMTKEKKVEIICGCFRGSIEEFEKKVEETHSGTVYEKQYKSIINVIKIKFGLTDFT